MKTSKLLITSLLAAATMSATAHAAGEVISINFGKTEDNITANMTGNAGLVTYTDGSGATVTGVGAAGWSNATGQNGTNSELKNYNGDTIAGASVTWVGAQAPYAGGPDKTGSVLSAIQHSYMDLGGNNKWNISVDTTFLVCDVYLYFSGDGNKYSPVNVNGTSYIGGTNVLAGSETEWGDRRSETSGTLALGTNAILVTGTAGALSLSNVPQNNTSKRATISGMQIVNSYAGTAHAATLGGDSAWSGVSFDTAWANSQSTVDAATGQITSTNGAYADFTLTADTTLTFDSVVTDAIYVSGEGKTLTLSNAGSGSLTLSGPATLRANAGATLAFDTTQISRAEGVSSVTLAGAGTIAFTDADGTAAYNKIGTDFTASSNTAVRIDGAVDLGESALAVSSGIREFAGGLTAGAVTVSGGTLILGGASTSFTSANVSSGTLKFDIGAGNEMVQSGAISGANSNASNLVIESGKLTLTRSDNNFRGVVQINDGGILQLNSGAVLQTDYSNANRITIKSGGELRMDNFAYGQLGGSPDYAVHRQIDGGRLSITGATSASGQSFTVTANGGEFLMEQSGQTLTLTGNPNSEIIALNGALKIGGAGDIIINKNASKVAIAGAGSLEKVGAGTLTINSAGNTYTGGTIVSEGVLVVGVADALGTGNVTVASGATLRRGIDGSVSVVGAFTTADGAILDLGALSADTAAFAVTGDVTLSAGTIFDVDSIVTNGKLISGAGLSPNGLGIANLSIGGYLANQRGSATFSVTDNTLVLSAYTAGAAWNITWNGGDDGVWKANGRGWTKDGDSTAANFQNGDSVTFGTDTTNTATLEGSLNVGALTVSANTTFSVADGSTALVTTGTLSLDANLTLNKGVTLKMTQTATGSSDVTNMFSNVAGTGTLSIILPNSNGLGVYAPNFAGTLYIQKPSGSESRLQLTSTTLADGASIELADGADLVLNATMDRFSHDIKINGTTELYFNSTSSNSVEFSGDITGAGTLSMPNDNTRTLVLSGKVSLGSISVGTNKNLTLSGTATVGTLTVSNGTVNLGGTATGTTTLAASAGTLDIGETWNLTSSASLGGTININGGMLTLTGANTTQTAKFNVNAGGTLKVTGHDSFSYSNSTGGVFMQGVEGNLANFIIADKSNGAYASMTLSKNITLKGHTSISSEGTSSFNTYGGKITATGTDNTISANIQLRSAFTVEVTNQGDELEISGVLSKHSDGNNGLTKTGAGKLILSGSNTYDCATTLSAGTLQLGHNNALGNKTNCVLNATGSDGVNEVTLSIDQNSSGNALTIANNISVSSGKTLILESSNAGNKLSGAISGDGALKKAGAGTLKLSGDNTFTGGVTLSAGTLEVGHNNALGGGMLTIQGTGTQAPELKLGTDASGNALTISNNFSPVGTVKVSSAHDGNKISGSITAFGAEIRKIGSGTLTLSGTNTGSSVFTVDITEGKIIAKSDTALGATLAAEYAGFADYHKVRLSGGQLEVGSGVTLEQTNIEIALSDAYSSTAAITGAGALAADTVVTISSIDTADLVGVSLLAESAITRYDFKIAETTLTPGLTKDDFSLAQDLQDSGWEIAGYADGTLSLTLTVPEPSVFGLLAGLGALALAGTRRRRQKKA